jgi:hypothetical protein
MKRGNGKSPINGGFDCKIIKLNGPSGPFSSIFQLPSGDFPFIDGLPIKNGDFPWLC